MPFKQVENPRRVFGDGPLTSNLGQGYGARQTLKVRNVSSASPITRGAAVVWSTATTDNTGVNPSTVTGSGLFAGIALTSASTGDTATLTSNVASTAWFDICVAGFVQNALVTTAVVPGDFVEVSSSTQAGGASNGGFLGVVGTTQGTAGVITIAGFALSSGDTATTVGGDTLARGDVFLRPSYALRTSL